MSTTDRVINRLLNEPARVVAVVLAIVGLLASFGLGLTDGQESAIVALVGSVLALAGGEAVRGQVTPTRKTDPHSTAE